MSDFVVVLVTAANDAQARQIARDLLQQKLAACVNLIPIHSLYVWEGAVQDEPEVLLIIKSTAAVFKDRLVAAVRQIHTYDVPEIIGMPIVLGAEDYLKWIHDEVTGS